MDPTRRRHGRWGCCDGAEPYRAPAGRKQRVQLRLGHTRRRRAPLVLRFAVGACVLLGGAAIVSAAMGRWPDWATRAYERVVGPRADGPAPARAHAHAPRHIEAPRAAAPPVAEEVPWPEIPIEPDGGGRGRPSRAPPQQDGAGAGARAASDRGARGRQPARTRRR